MYNLIQNQLEDVTGANGALPGLENDINCPALGEAGYYINYLSSSCADRLVTTIKGASCTYGHKCPRFKGLEPRKRIPVIGEQRPPEVRKGLTVGECVACCEDKPIKSLRLCVACYGHHHNADTLGQFDKYRTRKKRAKT